jgi:hypothetical protein
MSQPTYTPYTSSRSLHIREGYASIYTESARLDRLERIGLAESGRINWLGRIGDSARMVKFGCSEVAKAVDFVGLETGYGN